MLRIPFDYLFGTRKRTEDRASLGQTPVDEAMLMHPLETPNMTSGTLHPFLTNPPPGAASDSVPVRAGAMPADPGEPDTHFETLFPTAKTEWGDDVAIGGDAVPATPSPPPQTEANGAKLASFPSAAWWSDVKNPTVNGLVEVLSTEFASGWMEASASDPVGHVFAKLGDTIIGSAIARIARPDLDRVRTETNLDAYAFIILYAQPISREDAARVDIVTPGARRPLTRARTIRIDRTPPLRIFLFGSPRSGTSEMGTTLTNVLGLPWVGEGHAAPLFARAADALRGDKSSQNGLIRFMENQGLRSLAIKAARETYFFGHGSSSFLDKTPGAPMIQAAPFLAECFPGYYSIFLWRNPVANIMSRMVKFGGSFEGHCRDWAAAMTAWQEQRVHLPHYTEIRQEDMESDPDGVAMTIGDYLSCPEKSAGIAASLRSGRREQTGAGEGKFDPSQTQWSNAEKVVFDRICAPVAERFQVLRPAPIAGVSR